MKFDSLALKKEILDAIYYMGFEEMTPIQEQAIPKILEKKDLLGAAQTGTGKTAAFILPVLQQLLENKGKGIQTLVIVPTRELAIQIEEQIQGFSYFLPVNSLAVYGGGSGNEWVREQKGLSSDTDIVVATPGKLLSHLEMGYVNFKQLQHLILDEADRMLDMGFYEDIDKIISYTPSKRQTLLFSATMPQKIRQLANAILTNPEEIAINRSQPAEGILQAAYLAYDQQKLPLIHHLIADKPEYERILIFSATKSKVNEMHRRLKGKGYNVESMSSDLEQAERNEVLGRFRSKRTRIVVATDVLSRGIDIKDINLIINYDVPRDAEDYVHRVGRTARAEASGAALTLVNEKEIHKFHRIEQLIGYEIMKLPVPKEIGQGPD